LIVAFALAALTSAFLIFWLELLFTKMALPLLGGSPAVWNTCLMYFQACLLLGYLYAHLSTRFLRPRVQAVTHIALLAAALTSLPIAIPHGWTPPASGNVIPWLLLLLTVALGAPFAVLSSTAPLVQHWFASVDDPAAENPYVLYAASNIGSFFGLLAFPLILEPHLRLGQQSTLWTVGYCVAFMLVAVCAALATFAGRKAQTASASRGRDPRSSAAVIDTASPTARDRVRWLALAFVPSSLLLGVTTFLSTDVASAPLLWVVPLAIYLLTFVIVFARQRRKSSPITAALHAVFVTVLVLVLFWDPTLDLRWAYPLHLGVFALTALLLHGRLAAARPSTAHLTEYYLWMSLGGALGGAFNALVAPVIFKSIAEYELIVVLACFLRPSSESRLSGVVDYLRAAVVIAIPALLLSVVVADKLSARTILGVQYSWIVSIVAAAIIVSLHANALRFALSVAAVALAAPIVLDKSSDLLYADRSFFGAYRVERWSRTNVLMHGTTIHGAQFFDAANRLQPLTYYHPNGPAGQLFAALDERLQHKNIAAVGLGTGTLLCYSKPGQTWTVFEIDAHVEAIARDTKYFTFTTDCPVRPQIILGDARLTLASQPTARFELLILDAFSSDAIPVHLLTREALAGYMRVLSQTGVLLVHISNRHLDLEPVLTALAKDAGLVAHIGEHDVDDDRENMELDYSSDWVVLARREDDLGSIAGDARWRPLKAPSGGDLWTDDYSNILAVIKW
jgi:hypothetical protein